MSEQPPVDPTVSPDTAAGEDMLVPAEPLASGRKRGVVDAERLQIDPTLLATPLAAGWQRLGGIVVDLVVIGGLSVLSHPVLGLLTGITFFGLGTPRESSARVWRTVSWGLRGFGALIVVLSVFLLAGRPLVRSGAFNLAAEKEAPRLAYVEVSPAASTGELRRAVAQLETQVDFLEQQNAALRDEIRGNSWLRLAADSSRTMGFTFGWAGVYFTLCTALLRGRTLGKLIFRTRVARLDGQPITVMDAFVRNSGYAAGLATGLLGFARLLWDANRQAIQDRIASTVVVKG